MVLPSAPSRCRRVRRFLEVRDVDDLLPAWVARACEERREAVLRHDARITRPVRQEAVSTHSSTTAPNALPGNVLVCRICAGRRGDGR